MCYNNCKLFMGFTSDEAGQPPGGNGDVLRIIAGSCRGRTIRTPAGEKTRPTLARVRESLFGILQFLVRDAVVLDLYAGSGGLGIEALSRGAAHVVFNDRSGDCGKLIEENLRMLHLIERATVLTMDAEAALTYTKGCGLQFDIAFLDPPYLMGAQGALERLFLLELIKADGIAAVEHKWDAPPQAVPGTMKQTDRRRYGDTGICFFKADRAAD